MATLDTRVFTPKRSISWVWEYFKVCEDDESCAVCNVCMQRISRGTKGKSSRNFNTTNMITHMKKHKITKLQKDKSMNELESRKEFKERKRVNLTFDETYIKEAEFHSSANALLSTFPERGELEEQNISDFNEQTVSSLHNLITANLHLSSIKDIECHERKIPVPDLNERLGMDGSSSSGKIEGASSSFLTCSPLISSMPGIHEDVLSSGTGPSSSVQNSNENDGDYDEDMIDVKTEPVFNVESEICEEENSQSNTQSSSDRRSHQSSPTPSMIGPYLLKKETHCTTILDQLLRDDTFSDVTLTAEGQSIRAHKIVLCLASAYFRQVLSKESNVQNVIVFRDVKFSELKNLINFIYTGEATVDAADLESFMKTAEMLEVTSLCDGHRNFPKNLLPKTKESESEKVPSSTPSKSFPATKRSHAFSSAASNGSPPTKSRKTDAKDTSKKSSLVLPHPSTSGGGGGTSCPNDSIIEPTATIIKTEPVSEDSVAEEDYELKVGTDVSFESLTRSPPPPPLAAQNQVSTDLGENQSSLPDQSACSSTSLEKVPVGKCPLCPSSQPIRKGSELTKHLYAHHPDKTVFCCESCSRVFLKKGSFEAHKKDCNR